MERFCRKSRYVVERGKGGKFGKNFLETISRLEERKTVRLGADGEKGSLPKKSG